MANTASYAQTMDMRVHELTRQILKELPDVAMDFIMSIETTTRPLTRYAYARDIRMFLTYLSRENPLFSQKAIMLWNSEDFEKIITRDIILFQDYLSLYVDENDVVITNKELGKMRKICTLRSFFKWLYKNKIILADVCALVDIPKRHEKPILRLEIDEVARMLDAVESGEKLSEHQLAYNGITKKRDLAMLSLFLGTGIRVSECVGIDISDLDFNIGAFIITRKGGNQTILYFPDEVETVLKEYLVERREMKALEGHENALFLSLQKRRMGVRAVENMVKKYAMIAAPLKKKISPHKLRSTFGTNLYNETGDIYLVADVLGHADINTTRRHYAAMGDEHRRTAAKRVKLRCDETDKKDKT